MSMSANPLVPSKVVPSAAVRVMRDSPDEVAPTARTFFVIAGLLMVQTERPSLTSPSLPAAKMSRFSGFCRGGQAHGVADDNQPQHEKRTQ